MNLVWNYVSQIESPFSFENMLENTGLSEKEAKPLWLKLIAEGRLQPVIAGQYRYVSLKKNPPANTAIKAVWLQLQSGAARKIDIHRALGMSKVSVSLILASFEKQGWVKRGSSKYKTAYIACVDNPELQKLEGIWKKNTGKK